jgi:peptidoglycan/xylan/chitin deacetylase (PgdA/CDA1 family)
MNTKRKNISILVVLLFITMSVGTSISKQYNAQKALTVNSNEIETEKAKESVAIVKPEDENKIENIEPSAMVKDLDLKHNDKGIPIVMYHSIGYEEGNPARVTKENFREQMKYLKDNDYITLTLNDAYDFFVNNKPVPEKSIVITFDDGYVDNYIDAFPILKEFGFKATIFVITDLVDKDPSYMTSSQLKEMQANEIDIESHTVYHEHLKELSYEKVVQTLKKSKDFLEQTLNKQIKYLAYPYGEYSKETLKAVAEVGYTLAVTTDGRWSDKADGILTLDRVFISGAAKLDVFIERITNINYKF